MAERTVTPAVDPEVLAIVRQVAGIVRRVLDDPAYRVYLFGSWASGDAAARSDVDIGIEGPTPVSPVAMVKIREICDTLSTLRTVDIVDLGRVAPGFREGLVARSVEPEPRDRGSGARRIAILSQALARLQEALSVPEDPIVRDACIQRFEFTFEMAWRAIQAHARVEGLTCLSPRDCLRTAFRLGLVDDDPAWMTMVEDRNRTTYYDEASGRAIYTALSGHARLLAALLSRLREASRP